MPDKCECVDFQTLKLQELPDAVPQGEMPRHLQLFCDRYLCEKVVPGNRLTILGIYAIKKAGKSTKVWLFMLTFKLNEVEYLKFYTFFDFGSRENCRRCSQWLSTRSWYSSR
jgi:DNA replicative helicase MCM subunit Mcm2 (Cdc46/Mcm family)